MRHATPREGLLALVACFLLGVWSALAARPAVAANGEIAHVGQTVAPGYNLDNQTSSNLRSTIAVADTLTTTNVLALPRLTLGGTTGGRANVPVSIRFSNSGASVTFALMTFSLVNGAEVLKDVSPTFTVTAGSMRDENGRYVGPTIVLDSYGAYSARVVLMSAPTAGDVTTRAGSY